MSALIITYTILGVPYYYTYYYDEYYYRYWAPKPYSS